METDAAAADLGLAELERAAGLAGDDAELQALSSALVTVSSLWMILSEIGIRAASSECSSPLCSSLAGSREDSATRSRAA
ncbi:hypothetical protein [Saccharopolyspora gregorii]|uniref:Uncharacterized protein n=1 Tax=Saccharopolyspora gregorii TaxID=33914 RepID=A0ABP6S3B2_9PSEU